MKIRKIAAVLSVLCVSVFLAGASSCEKYLADPEKIITEQVDKTPNYVLSLHEIIKYKRGAMLEQEVDSFFGGTMTVNRNYFLHSRDIRKIEMTPRPGNPDFYDLKLTLSSRGHKLWSAIAVMRMENKKLCVLIDGMYYRSFVPEIITEPTPTDVMDEKVSVKIEGPFDPATAKGLVTNSERNFKIFNPNK